MNGVAGEELTTSYVYDNKGRLTTQTDPNGVVKHYTYDALGNRQSFVLEKGGETELQLWYT